ncbi:MAG: LPS export ABC transporter permease LptF [Betaproteobacteria bacterium]|nr:LPS export ABC transporter permease LptF [Betaproteobacteria bacterium]
MIFRRALVRELATNALAVFSVLAAITVTTLFIRLLGAAASGDFASDAIGAFLWLSLLNYMPVLLSLTLFIAVLAAVTRSYRESEMVVWFSAGMGLTAWIRPVLAFSAPFVALIAMLSFVLSPWALRTANELSAQMQARNDFATIAPGVFKESRRADRVYFVENFAGNSRTVRNVFVQSLQHHKLGVIVAQKGYEHTAANGDKFLVLLDGRRYEGTPGTPEYRVLEFARYAMRIEEQKARVSAGSPKSETTGTLIRQPTPDNVAELQWRLDLPLSATILALLAIPLSFANPRAGRSAGLLMALFIYMTYSNLLSISQVWVASGRISPLIGFWAIHLLMLALLGWLFYRRLYGLPSTLSWLSRAGSQAWLRLQERLAFARADRGTPR